MTFSRALLLAAAITLLHILVAIAVQGRLPSASAWKNLYQWDAHHYADIAANGYFSKLPVFSEGTRLTKHSFERLTNVAFFPGYPLAARIFLSLGIRKEFALLTVSALAASAFWMYLLVLCDRLKFSRMMTAAAVFSIASHPAAFFLVAGYSESLFLAMLLGMFYWMSKTEEWAPWIAAMHGLVLSLTRVVGMPLFAAPLIVAALSRKKVAWKGSAIISVSMIAGLLLFLLYCKVRFGWWLLYFERQRIGWGIEADYFLLGNSKLLSIAIPSWRFDENFPLGMWNPIAAACTFWFLVMTSIAFVITLCRKTVPSLVSALFFSAWILFYLTAAALLNAGWRSMIRYSYPIFVCAVLALLWSVQPFMRKKTVMIVSAAAWIVFCAMLMLQQMRGLSAFVQGEWIEGS